MAKNTTKMKAGTGTDEISVGSETIPVASDGTVEVPNEAVAAVESAGIATVEAEQIKAAPPADGAAPAPDLVTLISGSPGPGSLSWGGNSYAINDKGEVDVPHAAVADLLSHGFTVA